MCLVGEIGNDTRLETLEIDTFFQSRVSARLLGRDSSPQPYVVKNSQFLKFNVEVIHLTEIIAFCQKVFVSNTVFLCSMRKHTNFLIAIFKFYAVFIK